ncbi:MAG: SGNH/GDSL hydrolase family protein [Rubrobacteraceae bacterium]
MLRVVALLFGLSFLLASCASERPPLTYLSLGDSLAVGVGSSDPTQLGYAPRYEEALERGTGRDVDLVQLGVSGETSESFLDSQLVRAEEVLRENPDSLVTISLGANDLLSVADASALERERAIEQYGQNLDLILTRLASASEGRAEISLLALYNPIPGSFTDEWTTRLNEETRSVAERHDATVADGYATFRGHESEYINLPEDFHPTDAGYEALARTFEQANSGYA